MASLALASLLLSCRYSYELVPVDETETGLAGASDGENIASEGGDGGESSDSSQSIGIGASGASEQTGGGSTVGGTAGAESETGGAVGTGGVGDSSGGGNSTNSGGSGGSPSGGSGGTSGSRGASGESSGELVGDFIVTTGVDENDSGATAASPGGTGLSLREAIQLVNNEADPQVVTFDQGTTVVLESSLPFLTQTVSIVGSDTTIDGSMLSHTASCLRVDSDESLIEMIRFRDCTGEAMTIFGAGAHVVSNVVVDAGGAAVFVAGSRAKMVGNLFIRTAGTAFTNKVSGITFWFNTVVQSNGTGYTVGQSSGHDVRNNIFSHSSEYGISGTCDNFTAFDYNLFFENASGDINACTTTLGSDSVYADPVYADAASDTYSLSENSNAVDAGVDVGEDRNGSGSGNFDGNAPDLGFAESN